MLVCQLGHEEIDGRVFTNNPHRSHIRVHRGEEALRSWDNGGQKTSRMNSFDRRRSFDWHQQQGK